MRINLEKMSEQELTDLNNRIVARIKFLRGQRLHREMLKFAIGERVAFNPEGGHWITGVLTKYNRKTVSVITDAGERWNVAPGFLLRASEVETGDENSAV